MIRLSFIDFIFEKTDETVTAKRSMLSQFWSGKVSFSSLIYASTKVQISSSAALRNRNMLRF